MSPMLTRVLGFYKAKYGKKHEVEKVERIRDLVVVDGNGRGLWSFLTNRNWQGS